MTIAEIRPRTKVDGFDAFAEFGDVRRPSECDAPILGPELRQALHQWLYELNYAEALADVGVKPRQRAMLAGPPGTGKTTLAWHIAARLGVPLVVIEVPSLVSQWVGGTGSNIGRLFKLAREHGNNIALFFDEFDAVGSRRSDGSTSAGQEKNAIVAGLLQMIDRHEGLLFAATNRADNMDPAIWRRFQIQMTVGLPAAAERFAIIRRYLAPFDLPEETIEVLSEVLAGASPALIREVMESVKRDLVIGPRLAAHPLDAVAVFARIRASSAPSEDMPSPPLWSEHTFAARQLSKIAWPPQRAVE